MTTLSLICQISVCFLLCLVGNVAGANYGILSINSTVGEHEYCLMYYPDFSLLPGEKTPSCYELLADETASNLCATKPQHNLLGKTALLEYGNNCSITEQANVVQEFGGKAVLFIVSDNLTIPQNVNNSHLSSTVSIPVAFVHEEIASDLKDALSVCMYTPANSGFDVSFLVTWLIAMFSICVGSYWSGIVRFSIYSIETQQVCGAKEDREDTETATPTPAKAKVFEPSSLAISVSAIAIYVLFIVGLLMLLYYFYDYLVYFMIGLFTLLTIISTFCCLNPIFRKILPNLCVLVKCNFLDGVSRNFDYRNLIVLLISFAMPITWVVARKESYAWILLDILGIMFCIHLLKTFRLPNLKICSLLLVLLFFYDIFFVFVTPFLTAGKSVMEQVADSDKKEKLPMMFQIPRFQSKMSVCGMEYSILGFGDVLVPGLLVSFLRGFDLIKGGTRGVYHIVGCISYGIGLLLTIICLYLMRTAQPALLHIVPCTLLSTLLLGWYRGDLKQMWIGFEIPKQVEDKNVLSDQNAPAIISSVEMPDVSDSPQPPSSLQAQNSLSDLSNERKHLLQ